jgi:hypothetical protein
MTLRPEVLPGRIGPAEIALVAVRCPSDLDPWMQKAAGLWDPGGRRWLIERKGMGPLIRNLSPRHRSAVPPHRHRSGKRGLSVSDRPPGSARTPSTAAVTPPLPGAWCRACEGTRWWTERREPKG